MHGNINQYEIILFYNLDLYDNWIYLDNLDLQW